MSTEEWRAIPGHPGYEASDQGQIRSITRQLTNCIGVVKTLQGRILQPVLDTQTGYLRVQLGRRVRPTPVHVYVLKAFVGECPDNQEGLHNNGVKTINYPTNLAWGSQSSNALDRVRHGTHQQAVKIVCPCTHSLFPPNLRHRSDGYRECLACGKAHSFINKRGLTKTKIGLTEFKKIADGYYIQIMEGQKHAQNC